MNIDLETSTPRRVLSKFSGNKDKRSNVYGLQAKRPSLLIKGEKKIRLVSDFLIFDRTGNVSQQRIQKIKVIQRFHI